MNPTSREPRLGPARRYCSAVSTPRRCGRRGAREAALARAPRASVERVRAPAGAPRGARDIRWPPPRDICFICCCRQRTIPAYSEARRARGRAGSQSISTVLQLQWRGARWISAPWRVHGHAWRHHGVIPYMARRGCCGGGMVHMHGRRLRRACRSCGRCVCLQTEERSVQAGCNESAA